MRANGLPGRMASKVVEHAVRRPEFELVPYSLTGPEVAQGRAEFWGQKTRPVKPLDSESVVGEEKMKAVLK